MRLRWIAMIAVAARAWFLFAHRIDSDEPQHLHVAWGWTRGLVQYRDVFDNHLPLLHVVFAPAMAFAPESSAVFAFMRLAIAPFAIGASFALFAFARSLYDTRVAVAAALLFSVMPPWLSKSVEFRNDTLWIVFWLVALALRHRPFWMGIAFALSLLASIKAIPLLLAHLLARRAFPPRAAAIGFALPLLVMTIAFAALGALDAMIYDTLLFNARAPVHALRRVGGAAAFCVVAPGIVRVSNRIAQFAAWYTALLLAFWPILTPRDFLPLVPLAALAIARMLSTNGALAACVLLAILASVIEARIWRGEDPWRRRFVDAVVATTGPDEFVLDLKGEAIFRRRAVPLIYEDVGRALTANGALADRGPELIVARHCCVAIPDSPHLPPRTRAYLNAHFIDAGPLRVCRSAR